VKKDIDQAFKELILRARMRGEWSPEEAKKLEEIEKQMVLREIKQRNPFRPK